MWSADRMHRHRRRPSSTPTSRRWRRTHCCATTCWGAQIPLTGPQTLTNTELVGVIGDVLGRPLRYQEVPPDLVRQRFIDLGFSAEFADAYMGLLEETVSKPALVTDDVEKILGRAPQTFGDAIRARRDLFSN